MADQTLWHLVISGGFTMYPLVICSLLVWGVIFERLWTYRRLGASLKSFHLEATHTLLSHDLDALRGLCHRNSGLPTARLLRVALERISSKDVRLRGRWLEALERKRQLLNFELRQNLWILGTIGSSAPFIGLLGTVVGILRSFQEMAKTGSGGFTVVAAGISEALVTTAAGIVVAVIAVIAFNAFQTRWSQLVLTLRVHAEDLSEMLAAEVLESQTVREPVSEKAPKHGV